MEQSNSSSRLSKVSIKASSGLWLTSSAFRSLCRQYSCTSAGLPDRSSVSSRLCSQFSSTSCGQSVTFRLVRALLAQCRKRSRGLPLMSRLVSALSFTVRDSRAVKCWMPDRSAMPSPASRRSVTALSSVPVRRPSAPAPPPRLFSSSSQARSAASGKLAWSMGTVSSAARTPVDVTRETVSAAVSTPQRILCVIRMGDSPCICIPCRSAKNRRPATASRSSGGSGCALRRCRAVPAGLVAEDHCTIFFAFVHRCSNARHFFRGFPSCKPAGAAGKMSDGACGRRGPHPPLAAGEARTPRLRPAACAAACKARDRQGRGPQGAAADGCKRLASGGRLRPCTRGAPGGRVRVTLSRKMSGILLYWTHWSSGGA